MVCTKKPLLVLIVESRGFFGSANNASCLDNAFVSLHLRIPPRVLHFSYFAPGRRATNTSVVYTAHARASASLPLVGLRLYLACFTPVAPVASL